MTTKKDIVYKLLVENTGLVYPYESDDDVEEYYESITTPKKIPTIDFVSTDYQIPDEQKGVWIAYRRALRELPSTTEDPTNPVWPEKPMMPIGETSVSTVETDLQSEKSKVVLLQNVVFNLSKRIQALESA
jgi:cell envelope opacity-associated protein A